MFSDTFVRGHLPVYNPNGERVQNGELSEYPNYGLGPPENQQISLIINPLCGRGGYSEITVKPPVVPRRRCRFGANNYFRVA
jgi:hypothetical protein